MSTDGLSPPGSSTYSSNTMYVGDGTWDSDRNTFLLPNLVGLNFDTMRYNGMGNRFRELAGYKSIIVGHGVVAAVTFLGVVPAAILIARFYHRNPRLALRMHIWLQILTVFLTTVVFTLGWFAVGPERSLTNPHHGIGLAIFVAVLVQALGGALIHSREKGRERFKIPLKLMLHQWFGRAIAILGFVQVALGLTLWGSPKVLFILYAIWGAFLLVLIFYLAWRNLPVGRFDDGGTYISDVRTEYTEGRPSGRSGSRGRSHRGLGALAAAGAAGAGLAALRKRSRSRRREREDGQTEVLTSRHSSRHSRRHSGSLVEEKYTEDGRDPRKHTWRDRLLAAGAGAGALAALKSLFDRKRKDRESDAGSYSHPLGGPHSITQTDLSRVEEGRAPASPNTPGDRYRRAEETSAVEGSAFPETPTRRPRMHSRRSGDSISSYDSRTSFSDERPGRPLRDERDDGFGLKEGLATLGVAGFLKHKWNQRRDKKEQEHADRIRRQEDEDDRIRHANSRPRYTGNGPTTPQRPGRRFSDTEYSSAMTGSNPELSRHTLPRPGPMPASAVPPVGLGSRVDTISDLSPPARHARFARDAAVAGAAGAAGAAAATGASHRHRSHSRQRAEDSPASPPVSVKVKMHNDGRSVTLRRLNETEAAAEREAHRRQRRESRRRAGSLSSVSGDERWRRSERREAAQAKQMAAERQQQAKPLPTRLARPPIGELNPYTGQPLPGPPPGPPPPPVHHSSPQSVAGMSNLPGPPPVQASSGIGSGMGSPGYETGTGTDMSAYDSNRRRRRAERARSQAQEQQRGTGGRSARVEFT
ncbi:hypothetical protein K490DRAFT_45177 [Saccharata proteae CBS 121410]|uniref:Cytochrome b561 domain-containing protein n=1 Tax=Saccharata proteae CBS 121410 TaxID=1314787 RepID=A0A9P4HUK6_9PEZI|nr:hypothetical protein K490DRAFT_45177 [Saccharata proteae CBS 121410]